MKQELLETCKDEPEVYLHLNLQNQIQRERSSEEKGKKEEPIKREEKKEVIKREENVEEK